MSAPRPNAAFWVFGEVDHTGRLAGVTAELLHTARCLAAPTQAPVAVILFGHQLQAAIHEAAAYGAAVAFVADAPELAAYDDAREAAMLARLVLEHQPAVLLGGATAVGRALLPRVAVLTHTGLTADCTRLELDQESGLLLQTRPAFGGNLLATITCARHRPQMATVRPGVLPAPVPDATAAAPVIIPVTLTNAERLAARLHQLTFRPRRQGSVDLRAAEVVVTAGLGCGGPPGVALVVQLAAALGGAVGATRAVVDAGWLPYEHQVGQTGLTVQPKLYIACGVSGAIQHRVGMQDSGCIVAITRDATAPICNHADLLLLHDLRAVIPEILRYIGSGYAS